MKKINALLLPLLLISSLSANEKLYSFIGIEASASKFGSEQLNTFGFKYGTQTKELRTSIAYNYGKKSDNSYQNILMQIDTGVFKESFKNIPFKPYIGATFGLIQENSESKDRGYIFGPNVGLSYIINNSLDLDLGYRYLKTAKLNNIDEINDLTISMHYFY